VARPRSTRVRTSRFALLAVLAAVSLAMTVSTAVAQNESPARPDRPTGASVAPAAPDAPAAPAAPSGPTGAADDVVSSDPGDSDTGSDAAGGSGSASGAEATGASAQAADAPDRPARPTGPTSRPERPERPHRTPTCGCPTVHVIKQVVDAVTGAVTPGAGFVFSITNVVPEPVETFPYDPDNRPSATTDASGEVVLGAISAKRVHTLTIVEQQKPGFSLRQQGGQNAVCTDEKNGGAVVPVSNVADGFVVDLPHVGMIRCVVQNETAGAGPGGGFGNALIIRKNLRTGDTTAPEPGVSFAVSTTGAITSAASSLTTKDDGTTFTELTAADTASTGTVTIAETVPEGETLESVSCNGADLTPDGSSITLPVTVESGTIDCTFTNSAAAPVVEQGEPTPAQPGGLPFTGTGGAALALLGFAALGGGTGLYMAFRRRRVTV
jgi:hypothetical protein